jgi:hypothetical protein
VFQFEYTNVPDTFSVILYTPPTLSLDCYRHGTTATTVTKACKIPLTSHKEFVFVFDFKTTVSKKFSSKNYRTKYLYFVLGETQLIPQYERCMSVACKQFLLFKATAYKTPKNKAE